MKRNILIVAVIVFVTMFNFSCDTETEEKCEPFDAECNAPDLATICCDDTECYYTYQGKKYTCEDSECNDGIEKLLIDMCGSATEEKILALKLRLQQETAIVFQNANAGMD